MRKSLKNNIGKRMEEVRIIMYWQAALATTPQKTACVHHCKSETNIQK